MINLGAVLAKIIDRIHAIEQKVGPVGEIFVKKSGDTMTGNLTMDKATVIVNSNSGTSLGVKEVRAGGSTVSFGVGSGNTNHGVYSNTLNKWIVYGDASNVYLNGNADTATKATQDASGNEITSTYVKKAGDTMSGGLTISGSAQKLLTIQKGANSFNIGYNSDNYAWRIRDNTNSKNIMHVSAAGNANFYGNATTATTADNGFKGLTAIANKGGTSSITFPSNSFSLVLIQRKSSSSNTHTIISVGTSDEIGYNIIGPTPASMSIAISGLTMTLTNSGSSTAYYSIMRVSS